MSFTSELNEHDPNFIALRFEAIAAIFITGNCFTNSDKPGSLAFGFLKM